MPPHTTPAWQHTNDGLVLQLGHRRDPVPKPINDWLIGPGGVGLSGDAANDLLRMESRLRRVIAQLVEHVKGTDERIAAHRAEAGSINQPQRRRGGRPRPSRAVRALHAAIGERSETMETLEGARTLQEILRTYVIDLDPPHGPLREAAVGWRRRPDPPASVVVFDDEGNFLDADPRRATTGDWGGSTVAGVEQFGFAWRRDGDEDDPAGTTDELTRAGPWQLGYVDRTGEIYAIRRCRYLSRQLWLLGSGFDTVWAVRDLLLPIMPRMAEPNSLILVAGTVHAAQLWHTSSIRQSAALHRPSNSAFDDALDTPTSADGTVS